MTYDKHTPLNQQIGTGHFIKQEVMVNPARKKKSHTKEITKSEDEEEAEE